MDLEIQQLPTLICVPQEINLGLLGSGGLGLDPARYYHGRLITHDFNGLNDTLQPDVVEHLKSFVAPF